MEETQRWVHTTLGHARNMHGLLELYSLVWKGCVPDDVAGSCDLLATA